MTDIQQLIKRYGIDAHLTDGEGWNSETFQCFIQPLRYKNKMYLDGVNTVIGYNNQGHYLYLGPANHDLTQTDNDSVNLQIGNTKYIIDRAERVYRGKEVFYIWAIVRTVVEV